MPRDVGELERWIAAALEEQILGNQVAFITRRTSDGGPIGSTRFLHIDRANKTAEIGWTFLGRDARRTVANTEAKYLQLRHAFDTLGAARVWLKTDAINVRSQQAIERIGAKLEGTIRNERFMPTGRLRDAKYYSILDREWPEVRTHLEALLAR